MTQNCIQIMFGGWKTWKKQLLLIFHQFWTKIALWKKKLEKFSKNTKICEFPKFLTKNTLKNSKFYFVQYGPKMHKNVLWDLKKPTKSIFNDFYANLDQKKFLKKSFKNASKYRKNWHFWAKNGYKIRKLVLSKMIENCMKTVFRN